MEKQGVVFTEKAWKDFLDFLKEVKAPGAESEEDGADQIVDAYYKQQKPQKQRTAEELDQLYVNIYDILYKTNKAMSISDIVDALHSRDFYEVKTKSFSATMTAVMKKFPDVYRIERGVYAINPDYYNVEQEAEHE